MKCFSIRGEGDHRWLVFGQDPGRPESVVETNQVVVCAGGSAMLLDPGGMEVFPTMMAALIQEVDIDSVRHVFLSHQDPDVASALPLWRQVCRPNTPVYAPRLWTSYIAHFDSEATLTPIPDEGMEVALSPQVTVRFLPSHYLHSSGAFCVHDPKARVLFTGDIGSALVPAERVRGIFVTDFAEHTQYMAGFHQRWLGSNRARDAWVAMVARLDVDYLVPQHGLVLRGDDVKRFLDWLGALPIASGLEAYRGRLASA